MSSITEAILAEVQEYINIRWGKEPSGIFTIGATLKYRFISEDDTYVNAFLEYDDLYYYIILNKLNKQLIIKEMFSLFVANSELKYIEE